jgi:hypothetical protein
MKEPDGVVRCISHQDAEDHIELEGGYQAAAPLGRGQLSNVDRSKYRRRANAQSADEAEYHERVPVPGEAAAEGRRDIEHCGDAQGLSAAELLAHSAGPESSQHRANEPDGDRQAFVLRAQSVEPHQGIDGT